MGERTRYEPGTFCWVGLATSDPAGAQAFYTSLFGWQAEDLPAGAAVFREPFDVLDAGRVAAIRDPIGAMVSLWQPRSQIGATLVNDIGALRWNELATTDVQRAKSFYGQLFGWGYETDDSGYTTIMNAGSRNGGMHE